MSDYLLIPSVSLVLFWVAYKGLLQSDTLFARNRLYLLLSSAIALVLPFVDIGELINRLFIQEEQLPRILLLPYYATTVTVEVNEDIARWHPQDILTALWIVVAGLMLLQSAFQVWRLYRFVRQNEHQTVAAGTIAPSLPVALRTIRVIPTNGLLPTSSFGKWLFWDNTQPLAAHDLQSILLHEYAHITQRHTWDVLYMEILRALLWFHPVAWLYIRELRIQHEYLADASAARHTAPQAYIRLMAMATLQSNHLQPIHTFFSVSSVKKRMTMLTKPKTSLLRGHLKTVAALSIVAAVGTVASCTNSLDRLMRDQQVAEANKHEKIAGMSAESANGEVFTVVDKSAEPEMGMAEFLKVLGKNLRYPAEARRNGVQGKVFVQFIIDEQGNLIQPNVVKGVSPELDAEAVRVLQLSGKWTPGEHKGNKVKQRIVLPINFALGTGNPAVMGVETPAIHAGLIIIDGKEADPETFKSLPKGSIKAIRPLQTAEELAPYGEKGKNGVLEVFTDKTIRHSSVGIEIKGNEILNQQYNGEKVEKRAEPPGGIGDFMLHLGKNLKYPIEARKADIQGTVLVSFTIDQQGNVRDAQVTKGIGGGCDEEALRLVQNSGQWTPAEHNGRKVAQNIVLPVIFKLGN